MEIDHQNILLELTNYLRNSDILTTTQRGVATKTDTFTSTANQKIFTLTSSNLKNVRSVSVDGVIKTYGIDYSISLNDNKVTLTSELTAGIDVIIVYDHGTKDKIYSNYPMLHLKLSDFPRISINITNVSSQIEAFRTNSRIPMRDSVIIEIGAYAKSDIDIMDMQQKIRTVMRNGSYYYLSYIIVQKHNPILISQFNDDLKEQTVDYISPINISL